MYFLITLYSVLKQKINAIIKKNVEERSKFSDNLQYFRNQSCKSIQESTLKDLFSLVKSRTRRSFKRAYNLPKECRFHVNHNTILNRKIKKIINNNKAILRTHVRKYSILPHIFNKKIYVHNGSTFKIVRIKVSMLGRRLGEFSLTYKAVKPGAPGIGATHSSRFIPLR